MRNHNESSIKDIIEGFIAERKLTPKLLESKVVTGWKDIVGEMIFNHTEKMYVKEGILYVYINAAPLKQELNFQKTKIAELVNTYLGQNFIEQVVIR